MAKAVVETTDWKLGCFMDWREKHHSEQCPSCHGIGEVGGGFKDLDGSRQCPKCLGLTYIMKGATTPKPELPADLVEHMRRAWWDYLNAKESSS